MITLLLESFDIVCNKKKMIIEVCCGPCLWIIYIVFYLLKSFNLK